MNRRTILATAGAITIVLVTGAAAVAANVGLLGSAGNAGEIGTLTPAAAVAEPQTVIVEPAPATQQDHQATSGPASTFADDDDRAGDDRGGDDEHSDDDHGDDHDEHYEGSDDDD